jgi:hypothetical protein
MKRNHKQTFQFDAVATVRRRVAAHKRQRAFLRIGMPVLSTGVIHSPVFHHKKAREPNLEKLEMSRQALQRQAEA